jgi:hypothetical protein
MIIEGMVDTTDAEHYLGYPQCAHKPLAALLAHSEQAALPSHQKAINNYANKTATPGSTSVPWTMSLTLLYSQVTPVNIDAIDPSQPVTSLYSWVTPVNIDPIDLSQPVTLQIPQAAPNKGVHNEAHGLLYYGLLTRAYKSRIPREVSLKGNSKDSWQGTLLVALIDDNVKLARRP